jgi:ADP-sugar diphosphatase
MSLSLRAVRLSATTYNRSRCRPPLNFSTTTTSATTTNVMASFTLPSSDPPCPVSLPEGLTKEKVMAFRPFREWTERLQRTLGRQQSSHPYKLRSVSVQSWDMFGQRIGFIKIQSDVSDDAGQKLPGAVFLRGASVAMMVG